MKRFNSFNNYTGWLVFLLSAVVYLLTIEPTTSFWDCGEFIAAAYKLEVGHPPGAPFFLLMGRLFALFAPNPQSVAMMINAMSALASAFTILFLFWTITHLARRLMLKPTEEPDQHKTIVILASGVVGALAYTFSDTFWFSAVEAEVYAFSSLFTAIVVWAILKWENVADEPHANRWLIFIAYIMGLSIGVHLLNLLTIPALVLVYYFRKYTISRKGVIAALFISGAMLLGILYIIIPGVVSVAAKFELLFVNSFGFPFKSGVIFYAALLLSLIILGLRFTMKRRMAIAHSVLLGVTVILIGYSSYAVIVIRSLANPPMNENEPSNIFSLLSYLNREQYGDRPLVYGQYYNAPVDESNDLFTYRQKDGKYVKSYLKTEYKFDERFQSIFPRMYSPRQDHVAEYKKWANIKGMPVRISNSQGESEVQYVPTFSENLKFFFSYQMGFMYWRYFMWNFSGRQNDVQGHGELQNGNWITGIPFLDQFRLGNQEFLTSEMKNTPSRNKYFMLPLILGIVGMVFQFMRDKNNGWVVLFLFVLTGLAIVVYLNQTPIQPRERDYAYAGSFYAFCIWIGIGVIAAYEALSKRITKSSAAIASISVCMVVPAILFAENWDDHDRSGRYVARDFAHNYLNSCEPNAILFTNGDNDTFPLWYAQEVEGVRTDIRVVNLSLLGTDWYTEQMKRKAYDSEPLPITMDFEKFVQGTRDIVYLLERVARPVELKQVMDFIASDRPETKYRTPSGEMIDIIPTKNLRITVDREAVLQNGVVRPEDAHLIETVMDWTLEKDYIQKNEMMVLEIIANNNWKRPIYFVSTGGDGDVGLSNFLQLEGFAYKLVPIKSEPSDFLSIGRLNVDKLYSNFTKDFKWGGMNDANVYVDHNIQRTAMVLKLRNTLNRLADELISMNRIDSAVNVIDRAVELLPHNKFPYDFFVLGQIEGYYKTNETEKANRLLVEYVNIANENLDYYFSLKGSFAKITNNEKEYNLEILRELLSIATKNGQTDIQNSIEEKFNFFVDQHYRR
jgi:MFS family permease